MLGDRFLVFADFHPVVLTVSVGGDLGDPRIRNAIPYFILFCNICREFKTAVIFLLVKHLFMMVGWQKRYCSLSVFAVQVGELSGWFLFLNAPVDHQNCCFILLFGVGNFLLR